MSNERMSEGNNWKDRLSQLEQPPDVDGIWKEAAWEKLYTRFQEESPRKKRAAGYWVAAACLVIVGAIGLLRIPVRGPSQPAEQGQAPVVSAGRVSSGDHRAEVPPSGDRRMGAGSPEHPNPVLTGSPLKGSPAMAVKEAKVPPAKESLSLPAKGSLSLPAKESITGMEEKPDFLSFTANPAKPLTGVPLAGVQRKLRVVHVNELETPAPETVQVSQTENRPALSLHLSLKNTSGSLASEREFASTGPEIINPIKVSLKN